MKASIEIGERLKKLREHYHANPRQFALSNDFDASVWARIEKGKTGLPEHYLKTILDIHNVDSNWLITGEGDMFRNNKTDTDAKKPVEEPDADWREKYYATLEEKAALIDKMANRAILLSDKALGAFSTLKPQIDALEETVVIDRVTLLGTQEFLLEKLAPLANSTPDLLRVELGKKVLAERKRNHIGPPARKKGTVSAASS